MTGDLIAGGSRIEKSAHVVGAPIDTGYALLDTKSNEYFYLNKVGSVIWEDIERGMATDEIIDDIAGKFSAPRERIALDVKKLLSQLSNAGLVVAVATSSNADV